jgi:hypothetical protein
VNSTNIRQINLRHHRSCIAYVGQEPVLFNMSIRDNIIYGCDKNLFDMNDIIAAATKANIHAFIKTLPEVSILCASRYKFMFEVLDRIFAKGYKNSRAFKIIILNNIRKMIKQYTFSYRLSIDMLSKILQMREYRNTSQYSISEKNNLYLSQCINLDSNHFQLNR